MDWNNLWSINTFQLFHTFTKVLYMSDTNCFKCVCMPLVLASTTEPPDKLEWQAAWEENTWPCLCFSTLFESENEWQKIEPVPILLTRTSRNFSDVKTRNNFFFYNWTSEIIPVIHFGKQMDRTKIFFWNVLSCIFYSYPTLLLWVMVIFPLEMV